MSQAGLANYFREYIDKQSIFKDKKVLQIKYTPDMILHRQMQIKQLASILAPALKREKPSNLFIYGKTGTGKTLCTMHTIENLKKICEENKVPLKFIYINCKLKKVADTEYRILAQFAREMEEDVPATGLPTDEIYNLFLKKIDKEEQIVVLILDEIDQIVRKIGDGILYNLTRINSELKKAQLSVIGISNDVRFTEHIDARVKSSLGEEEIIFPPYNAIELKEILTERSKVAFRENCVKEGVLAKCAAYAAREHGDARRAIDLLRVAAELADRDSSEVIDPKHIDDAEERIEKDRVVEIVKTQPKQSQSVLLAILNLANNGKRVETGEIFEIYKQICTKTGQAVLTQRRISDLISELDMLGLINAKVVSKGRYGRTREVYITIPPVLFEKIKEYLKGELV